jgi:hypothetical protein
MPRLQAKGVAGRSNHKQRVQERVYQCGDLHGIKQRKYIDM